ncbi:hypothetical protein [Tepidibacter formicigenes]|jgi:hypothetical protein|nr:hypothetical protein [Tepidibacter formicigenes]
MNEIKKEKAYEYKKKVLYVGTNKYIKNALLSIKNIQADFAIE